MPIGPARTARALEPQAIDLAQSMGKLVGNWPPSPRHAIMSPADLLSIDATLMASKPYNMGGMIRVSAVM